VCKLAPLTVQHVVTLLITGLTGHPVQRHPVPIFRKKLVDVGGDGMVRDRCTDQLHFFFNQLLPENPDGMDRTGWSLYTFPHTPLHYAHGLRPVQLLSRCTKPRKANVLAWHQFTCLSHCIKGLPDANDVDSPVLHDPELRQLQMHKLLKRAQARAQARRRTASPRLPRTRTMNCQKRAPRSYY
jgi:hypothetical protein